MMILVLVPLFLVSSVSGLINPPCTFMKGYVVQNTLLPKDTHRYFLIKTPTSKKLFLKTNDEKEKFPTSDFTSTEHDENYFPDQGMDLINDLDERIMERLGELQQEEELKSEVKAGSSFYTSETTKYDDFKKTFWGQTSVELLAAGVSLFFIATTFFFGDSIFVPMNSSPHPAARTIIDADSLLKEDFDRYESF